VLRALHVRLCSWAAIAAAMDSICTRNSCQEVLVLESLVGCLIVQWLPHSC
jgi:hypothetical protein